MHKLSWPEYEALFQPLSHELSSMARWVAETGQRIVVIFEGRDTAGKGGSIDMIARTLNPRQCRVVALSSPSERERGQWYFQRYIPHLPAKGEIALFDRSWYNRAGVERVMGYCSDAEAENFLEAVPEFERHLVNDGILLFKYWLCCDQEAQERRFGKRLSNPVRRWKLSPIDLDARQKYQAYTDARERMLEMTHTAHAPWTLIEFDDQQRGRLTLLRDLLDRIPDVELPQPEIAWPPLGAPPNHETYRVLQPIPSLRALPRADGQRLARRPNGRSVPPSIAAGVSDMRALRLFIRMTVYYAVIVALVMIALRTYPHMQDYLPIGGVKELLTQPNANPLKGSASIRAEAVGNFGESLFWLTVAIAGALLTALPVSWVYMGVRNDDEYDQSLINTILILPVVVTGIVIIVQNSLALAFSLGGIAGAVRFKNSLKSSGDALFILLSIGIGLSAGIGAVELALMLSAAFNYCFLALWVTEYGERAGMKRYMSDFNPSHGGEETPPPPPA